MGLRPPAALGARRRRRPSLHDAFAAERRKAKMLNFSIAYGKTPLGLSRDWKVYTRRPREMSGAHGGTGSETRGTAPSGVDTGPDEEPGTERE
ncbi:hypothetical protein KSP40_PGU010354 [Platanthera guangdongensis]|uniref:Uncharacterized protein n=1 Tax=Platanthera guangdongensis TaxID=2320717 RepID=A0ABR2MQK5_9ASPA